MGDRQKTALQERGETTYPASTIGPATTLAEIADDCVALGIDLHDVTLFASSGVIAAALAPKDRPC